MRQSFQLRSVTLAALAAVSCTGKIIGDSAADPSSSGPAAGPAGGPSSPSGEGPRAAPGSGPTGATFLVKSGLRRLTRDEYRNTLQDLLGFDPLSEIEVLPQDSQMPFDNDYTTQVISRTVIEAIKSVAERSAARVMSDPALRARVVGCQPTGPGDAACFRRFITAFGRRALRRPLAADEVDRLAGFQTHAVAAGDFYRGATLVLRALLQDLEFVYRVEIGTPVPGQSDLVKLGPFEVASRLSYFLWGSAPDDALLDTAARGALSTGEQIRSAAQRLWDATRARQRVNRFHAMWLGYAERALPATLEKPMHAETAALIERVVFTNRSSWMDVLTSRETFIDRTLATHYGLPAPMSGSAWVGYGDSGRQGLLSHGTFLAVASKFNDTSPTQRGILIRERLMCDPIPPPPDDQMVDVDEPPKNGKCKIDRYAAHRAGGCAACHSKMDPVGFGLENYDQRGKFRTHDTGAPDCPITGEGELVGVGKFKGPAELGNRLIESQVIDACLVRQLYRFYAGRLERPDEEKAVTGLAQSFRAGGHRLDRLLMDLVASPGFTHRLVE